MSKEINITPLQARYLEDDSIIPESTSRKFLYTAVCIGNLVALTAGISLGWTSPVIPKLTNPNNLQENPFGEAITEVQESWIGSFLAVGAICGPFVSGYAADNIGRKKTLILCGGIPSLLAYLMLALGQHITLYYVGRFLSGFTVGSVFTVLPNFNSEIAEDSNRGAVASSINVFAISGPLFAYAIGPFMSIKWFSITCATIPAIFIVAFFLFVPESPYYLLSRNDFAGAVKSLKTFRSASESAVKTELAFMKLSIEESANNKASIKEMFKSKSICKALTISLTLVALQQLSGIIIILFYTQNIFEATGSSISSEISPIIVGSAQVLASFATPLFVDKMGRKFLLLVSAIGMIISEVPLGVYFYLKNNGKDLDAIFWLPIACLILYVVTYNIGFGPLPWTVMAEIFPPNVKAIASTATCSFCWIGGLIITQGFPSVSSVIGMAGSFWLFSGFCGLAIVFVSTYVIETKGKSFAHIQEALAK